MSSTPSPDPTPEFVPANEVAAAVEREQKTDSRVTTFAILGVAVLVVASIAMSVFHFPGQPELGGKVESENVVAVDEAAARSENPASPAARSPEMEEAIRRKVAFRNSMLRPSQPMMGGFSQVPIQSRAPQGTPHRPGSFPLPGGRPPQARESAPGPKTADEAINALNKTTMFTPLQLIAALNLCNVEFKIGSDELDDRSLKMLRDISQSIKRAPKSIIVEVGGHVDSTGEQTAKIAMSLRRAKAVRSALLSLGCPAGMFNPVGLSDSQPIADNRTAEGRAQNNRIVFRLL